MGFSALETYLLSADEFMSEILDVSVLFAELTFCDDTGGNLRMERYLKEIIV